MKMLMKTTASAVALLLALPACGQDVAAPTAPAAAAATTDADPALWVVKDADTTVYLFGTMHMLKPGLTWFDEAVKTAFDGAGEVVFELPHDSQAQQQQVLLAKGMNPAGPTLTERLPADKRAVVAKAMADAGVPQAAYDRMDPWLAGLVASSVAIQKLGYQGEAGPEAVLAKAAAAGGKSMGALETVEQQAGFFDGLSGPAQVRWLIATVEELPKGAETLGRMQTLWASGDPDGLAALMNDAMKDSPEVAKVLLADRNARWADWVQARMARPGTVFVAVGAGHLAGAGSVQAMLGKAGVRATRVTY